MKKFIIKILLLFSLMIIIDLTLSEVLDYGQTSDYKAFIESKNKYDEMDSLDIIFVGDSQTADCFVPTVFNNELNVKSFNYGIYLLSPVEQYFLVIDLVERHSVKPKLIVLGSNVNCFNYPVSYGRFTPQFIKNPLNLIPLLLYSKKFDALTSAGRKGYLFNSVIKKLQGKDEKLSRMIDGIDNGYLITVNHYESEFLLSDCTRDSKFFKNIIVEDQIEYFEKTLEYLNNQGIDVIVANPPMHKQFLRCLQGTDKYRFFQSKLEELAVKYNFRIFNKYHNLLLDELIDTDFMNGDHLCYSGAVKYSKLFSEYLLYEHFNQVQIAEK